jgi:hypothetical protein
MPETISISDPQLQPLPHLQELPQGHAAFPQPDMLDDLIERSNERTKSCLQIVEGRESSKINRSIDSSAAKANTYSRLIAEGRR